VLVVPENLVGAAVVADRQRRLVTSNRAESAGSSEVEATALAPEERRRALWFGYALWR
jgi:hypothetical protein